MVKKALCALLLLASAPLWAGRIGASEGEVGAGLSRKGPALWEQRIASQRIRLRAEFADGKATVLEWSCKERFKPAALWKILDDEGQGGDWFEVTSGIPLGDELAKAIDPSAQQSWLLWRSGEEAVLADMRESDGRSALRLRTAPVSLREGEPTLRYEEDSFADFVGTLTKGCFSTGGERCLVAHRDDPSLEVEIVSGTVRFSYTSKERGAFELPPNAAKMRPKERKELAQALRAVLLSDFDLAVRAFFATAPRFFDRQPWEWLILGEKGLVGEGEIDAWIRAGKIPETVVLFRGKARAPEGEKRLELTVGANGLYRLEIK